MDNSEPEKPLPEQSRYVSVAQAAQALGVHRNTVLNRIKRGTLHAQEVWDGSRTVYQVAAADLPSHAQGPHKGGENLPRTQPVDVGDVQRVLETHADRLAQSLSETVRADLKERIEKLEAELEHERERRERRERAERELAEIRASWLRRWFG